MKANPLLKAVCFTLSVFFIYSGVGASGALAQTAPARIPLDPAMITVEPGVGSDDEAELVDEQDMFPDRACHHSWENWGNRTYPQSVYLDLGREYVITSVHLFNHGGDGEFRVSSGTPGNWTVFVADPLIGYTGWVAHAGLSVPTRYVRLTKTTDGKMAELVLFGYPAGGGSGEEWTLTVLGAGAQGAVARAPDLAAYPDGTAVTLTAVPAAGFRFKHWVEGGAIRTENPLNLVMDDDRTIEAVFEPAAGALYTLTVSIVGSGSVSPPGGSFEPYAITLLATPAAGWRFDHWEGDLAGAANPQKLVMDRHRSVTAVFVPLVPGGSAKIALTPAMVKDEKTGGYPETPAANLVDEQGKAGDPRAGAGGAVATPWLPSWHDADHPWSCFIDLKQLYDLTDVYLFDHPWKTGDFSVSAGEPGNWVPLFTDRLERNNQWFGRSVNARTRYVRFTRHTATAFVDEVVLYGAPAGGTPAAQWTLAVAVSGQGSVARSPDLPKYPDGTTVSLLATPAPGYLFKRWEEGASLFTENPLALTLRADRSLKAVFEPQGGGAAGKLILTPAMMVEEKPGGYPATPAANLVDEQALAGDPKAGTGGAVRTEWMPSWIAGDYPWSCYIDLGQPTRITDIYLYDHEWKAGDFSVSTGAPGNWVVLFTDGLPRNNQWFGRAVDVTTRYLRFTRHSPTAFVDEVVLYGAPGQADTVPPAAVTTLAASPLTASSVALSWKATGDDGNAGRAAFYDLRYSTSFITEASWADAARAANAPAPAAAGADEALTVAGLSADTTYYFALKVIDDAGNASALSNVAQARTSASTTPQAKTFGSFMGSVYSMTVHADKLAPFGKLRLYLATPVIAQNASGPRDLAFDPVDAWYPGASLDAHLAARRANGAETMLVLETVPPYLGVPAHAVAAPPGADTKNPASYGAHAEMAFQIAARYGRRAVPLDQVSVRSGQTKQTGLGILARLQPYNETWEFWEGGARTFVKPDGTTETRSVGDWAPEEEVAMMTAVYHRVKQADPEMIVVSPSWLKPDPAQMGRAKAWADVVNGGKLPCDELAFALFWNSNYPSNTLYTQTLDFGGGGGKPPEALGGLKAYCDRMVDQVRALFPGQEVVIAEYGYDSEPTPQSVPEIGGKSRRLVQADWLVRSYLAIFASKVKALYQYMMEDSTEGGLFSSSGLVEIDNTRAKPAWYYTATVIDVLRNAVFEEESASGHPDVRIYRFRDLATQKTIFTLWCPTAAGTTVSGYALPVAGSGATLVRLADKSATGLRTTLGASGGALRLDISETPIFVIVD
jgi:hypothetical protein